MTAVRIGSDALNHPLVFGDPEQIQAIRALPRIIEPGQWTGVRVRFRPFYRRTEYVDPFDPDETDRRIADVIAVGQATVIEDRTLDPHDGRVLVRTAEGDMWCDPDDLQEATAPPADSATVENGILDAPLQSVRRWRVTVGFRGAKEYEVEARTREGAMRQALTMAADDEPEEWEPTDDVEVEEA